LYLYLLYSNQKSNYKFTIIMNNQTPNPDSSRITWIVVSTLCLAVAFYFTFVLNSIAQGIIWFGAAFALFTYFNNPKN
jgi:hypothetical protein